MLKLKKVFLLTLLYSICSIGTMFEQINNEHKNFVKPAMFLGETQRPEKDSIESTFDGPYFHVTGITLEGHFDSTDGRVYSNWAKDAPKFSGDTGVHGMTYFPGLKWGYFVGTDSVGSSIDTANIDDWMIFGCINQQNHSLSYAMDALLTKDGVLIDPWTGRDLHLAMPPGNYFQVVQHRTHISALSAHPIYIEGSNLYGIRYDKPEFIYGKQPLKYLGKSRFGLYTGDTYPEDFVGLLDWIPINNNNGFIGWSRCDVNNSGVVDNKDKELNFDNWYRMFQAPWVKRRLILEPIGFGRGLMGNIQRETVPYDLAARNFTYEHPTPELDVLIFDVILEGDDFIFGGCELVIKFDSTYLNGGEGSVTMIDPISNHHNTMVTSSELRFFLFADVNENDTVRKKGTRLCQIKFETTAGRFSGNSNMKWFNQHCNVVMERNDSMIVITDTNNHHIENNLTNISYTTSIPREFSLSQNYPNPFNPTTTIDFNLPLSGNVKLSVYDIIGKEIINIIDQKKDAGEYSVTIDASNLSTGTYFYRLEVDEFVETKKMMLIK